MSPGKKQMKKKHIPMRIDGPKSKGSMQSIVDMCTYFDSMMDFAKF